MKNRIFKTPVGNFSGYEKDDVINLKGIRYAISERFDVPKPFIYEEKVVKLYEDSPVSIQLGSRVENYLTGIEYEKLNQVESCQYLSISLPITVKKDSNLPVMVFIHGGAYRNGGCDVLYYNRTPIVKEGNVIIVSINYRLGIEGFGKDINGNYSNNGLLDVIEALKWINNNISYFGGNKDNITLFGQSAGADAIRCIMMVEGLDNLYKRVILQSDPIGATINRTNMEKRILDELNLMKNDVSVEEIRKVQESVTNNVIEKGNAKYLIFGPHYGVYPLPKLEDALNNIKKISKKHDVIIGSNTREASAYVGADKKLKRLYENRVTRLVMNRVIKDKSNKIFIKPASDFAKEYASYGGNVYLYKFYWNENKSPIGACHGMEFLLLFGALSYDDKEIMCSLSSKEIYELGKPMRKIWYSFAKNGKVKINHIDGILDINKIEV